MFDTDFQANLGDNFKQIEDIIDSGKLLGLYNVSNYSVHYRNRVTIPEARGLRFEESISANEGDTVNNGNVKQTESEITVVRVKYQDLPAKRNRNTKWDMQDIAVPGDGSHLADSPSLVNLVTLVGDNRPFEAEEYLVPLSSWEPSCKYDDKSTEMRSYSDSKVNNHRNVNQNALKYEKSDVLCSRSRWAGRISKFIRKHCSRTKPGDKMSNDDHK